MALEGKERGRERDREGEKGWRQRKREREKIAPFLPYFSVSDQDFLWQYRNFLS